MYGTDTTGDGVGWYRRMRRADAPVAVLVGVGDILLCGVLYMMIIASGITFGGPDETQQAEMDATHQLAERLYFGWLAGGLLVFSLFRLPRSVLTHLVCMVGPLAALLAYLAAAG
ncbi:hypothetical protein ACF1BN_25615 [Streptomyces sp. NPDC014861]|uniref:hypothetical protein n=1 Tax=Streptomyces sp. NPDC014861 TaxID=3364923 RepID=UPI0037004FD3